MGKLQFLTERTKETIANEGYGIFIKKAIRYTARQFKKENANVIDAPNKTFMDVLFINGCYLPHPSRYRVSHQREQLLVNNVASNEIFYEDLSLDLLSNYRVFIFFRCPITDLIEEFIIKAKAHNKTVLFDIDDLVIDTKYTDTIKYLKTLSTEEKSNYDSGVIRMQRTLKLCDAAITTTECLAKELLNYVPKVFINRNTASLRMVELSEWANYNRDILPYLNQENLTSRTAKKNYLKSKSLAEERQKRGIRMGYFSGSITHNDDFNMIMPVIKKLMSEFTSLELALVGEIDVPIELNEFKDRIIFYPFMKWEKLPDAIASVDINLIPLEKGIFNEAKSENKWTEASLVKVVTVASRVGAFEKMIEHNKTGLLCIDLDDWYNNLRMLILDKNKRLELANNAYDYVKKHCTTIYTGYPLYKFIKSMMKPNIAFVLPSVRTSGGVLVVFQHCTILKQHGYDVLIINEDISNTPVIFNDIEIPVISKHQIHIHGSFDKAVATLWSTLDFIKLYPNIKEKYYLVQNFETDFYEFGNFNKVLANQTYNACFSISYITISTWCRHWLYENYEKEAAYAPNGIATQKFTPIERDFGNKIRILIEGNSDDYYKNVDESFKIVDLLDKDRFEIWYMSYQGKPKPYYHVDKFLHKIPYDNVPDIYRQCHILIKSSILESFSYPPLEMMATGGFCVVSPNGGNIEYLKNEENCLFYETGDINGAVKAIDRICSDSVLRETLFHNGIKTANSRDWNNIKDDIIALYENQ